MEVKEIEGVRVKAGETLVVIPPRVMSQYEVEQYHNAAKKLGIYMLILPPHSRLYVKETELPRAAGYQPSPRNIGNPTPPGAA